MKPAGSQNLICDRRCAAEQEWTWIFVGIQTILRPLSTGYCHLDPRTRRSWKLQDHLECTHRPTYINPTQTYATHIHLESKQPNWRLHSQLILECSQRRCGVVGPVSPGTAGQAILLKKQSLLCCLMLSAKPAGLRMIFNASIFYGLSAINTNSFKARNDLLEKHSDDRHHCKSAVCQLG